MDRTLQQTGQQEQAVVVRGLQEGLREDGQAKVLLVLVQQRVVPGTLLPVTVVCLHLCAPAGQRRTLGGSFMCAARSR